MEYPKHEEIAKIVGDTFIDYHINPPAIQWSKICLLLNDSQFCIIRTEDADRLEEIDKITEKQQLDYDRQEREEG